MTSTAQPFPKGFFWGAATAGHQVEGNNRNDWTEWEKSERRLADLKASGLLAKHGEANFLSGIACDHYSRFREDFDLAKDLGHNATRFSIEWSRIEPEEGKFDREEIVHYRQVIEYVRSIGIEPFVTLWHWPIPIWLRDKGGWECSRISEYFTRYCETVLQALMPSVRYWITLNEPEIYTTLSYLVGIWPPQKRNPIAYLRVLYNLIDAHGSAYEAIKNIDPDAKVGIAKANIYFEAYRGRTINLIMKQAADWWWNQHMLNRIGDRQDFIGLNHYVRHTLNFGPVPKQDVLISDVGWELQPAAMHGVLMELKRYQKPIFITESGVADARDVYRAWFIAETLRNVQKAISEGVDVRGYLHWSLMDNFEWEKGFWPRFGLIEINRETLARTVRPSAQSYRAICIANGVMEAEVSYTSLQID
jgi:beta-glucosidase